MDEEKVSPEEDVREASEERHIENEDDEADDDEEEGEKGTGEKWVDVRLLEKMTLDELKQMGIDDPTAEVDRRLDPPITKVIVRRLPPHITIDGYLQELSEVPQYNYIRLVPPQEDLPSRIGKRSAIYINFETEQEAFWFKEKYNKMKFFDERGNSYIACVDFSFYQDVIKDPADDPQAGTLEESEMFQIFLKKYEEDPYSFTMVRLDSAPTPEIMLEEILNKKVLAPESTPLLEFLRERSEKKDAIRKERDVKRKERDIARREAKEREKDRQREKREKEREKRKERDKERRVRKEKTTDTQRVKDGQSEKSGRSIHQSEKDTERDKHRGKDKDEKDKQKPSASASTAVTYSRSGNPTRWSENSGPRKGAKNRKDDDRKKSQEKLSSVPSSSSNSQSKEALSVDKLPVEKSSSDNPSKSEEKSKSAFGKPFPVKDTKPSDNKLLDASTKPTNQQNTSSDKKGDPDKPEKSSGAAEACVTKKKIIKKVIKVRKVVKEDANGGNGNATGHQDSAEPKPKKVIRVVKKTTKSDNNGSSNKPATSSVTKKDNIGEQGAGDATTATEIVKETERERKTKRGRPEIQIYRPGSLRGGVIKSTTGDKDRDENSSSNT